MGKNNTRNKNGGQYQSVNWNRPSSRTWDILNLLNIGSWGNWLRSLFHSVTITGLLTLGVILLMKFLLSYFSRQMSFSQMYVQNKVPEAYHEAQLTVETNLTTLEEYDWDAPCCSNEAKNPLAISLFGGTKHLRMVLCSSKGHTAQHLTTSLTKQTPMQ